MMDWFEGYNKRAKEFRPMPHLIANPADAEAFKNILRGEAHKAYFDGFADSQWNEESDANNVGAIAGIEITSSSLVEPGRIFLVSKEKRFEPEYNAAVMSNVGAALEDEIRYRIASALGVPNRYWRDEYRQGLWQANSLIELPVRKPGESLVAWARRLNLDDPAIRWTYQRGVFAALVGAITGLIVRVRGHFVKPL